MTEALNKARRILERTGQHPVLSLYFDLDPAEFATAPARASQLRSLIDEARAEIDRDGSALSHDDRQALIADVKRVQAFLEPLVATAGESRWCVCLVNRSTARVLAGNAAHLWERGELEDDVKGRHKQGGWSQARSARSIDVEVERHLQHVADELHRRWEREPFHTLALGGPEETLSEFRSKLHGDLVPVLAEDTLSLDVQNSSEGEIRQAVVPLLEKHRVAAEQRALEQIRAAQGGGAANGVIGIEATLLALGERRVEKLLLAPDFHHSGGRCPTCGLLVVGEVAACPADGTPIGHLDDLREAAVEAAIAQDAAVLVFGNRPPETHLRQGIGAVLRF